MQLPSEKGTAFAADPKNQILKLNSANRSIFRICFNNIFHKTLKIVG